MPTVRRPLVRRPGVVAGAQDDADHRREGEQQVGLEGDRVELEHRAVEVEQPRQVARPETQEDEPVRATPA